MARVKCFPGFLTVLGLKGSRVEGLWGPGKTSAGRKGPYEGLQGPPRPHEHKDPTHDDFWNPPLPIVESLCLCGGSWGSLQVRLSSGVQVELRPINWRSVSWMSSESEPYYLEFIFGLLIFGNSHICRPHHVGGWRLQNDRDGGVRISWATWGLYWGFAVASSLHPEKRHHPLQPTRRGNRAPKSCSEDHDGKLSRAISGVLH